MLKFAKILAAAVVISGFAMSSAAAADDSVSLTRAACYFKIQQECYGGGETNCTEEEYNMGLDWCDDYFEIAVPSNMPTNLKAAPPRSQKFRLKR